MKATLGAMAPEYAGKVNIMVIIDQEHWDLFLKYKITAIPTQVFFDADGNIVMNHIGTLSKDQIIVQFNKMGIE